MASSRRPSSEIGPAEVGQAVRLVGAGPELPVQVQRLAVVVGRLGQAAQLLVHQPEVGEVGRPAGQPPGPPADRQRLGVGVGRLLQPPQLPVHQPEAAKGGGLAFEPPGLLVEPQRLGAVLERRLVTALAHVHVGQAELGGGLAGQVPVRLGGGQGGVRGRQPVDDVHAEPEVAAQGIGQQPRRRPRPVLGGVHDGGHQVVALGVQPGQRLGVVAEACRRP